MRHRQPTPSSSDNNDGSDISSSDNSNRSDTESCFNIEDKQEETDTDTDPMDVDSDIDDIDGGEKVDLAWIAREDNAYLLEYYLDQENNSDESEDEEEDYSNKSTLFFDMLEAQFQRYAPYSLRLPPSAIKSMI
jgi:hypothetical protein